jgi:hypothetical protein
MNHQENNKAGQRHPSRSTIEQMIDAATGYKPPQPKKKRTLPTAEEKLVATDAGNELIWYIDAQYPAMWAGVPKAARTSVKNTVYNRVISILLNTHSENL